MSLVSLSSGRQSRSRRSTHIDGEGDDKHDLDYDQAALASRPSQLEIEWQPQWDWERRSTHAHADASGSRASTLRDSFWVPEDENGEGEGEAGRTTSETILQSGEGEDEAYGWVTNAAGAGADGGMDLDLEDDWSGTGNENDNINGGSSSGRNWSETDKLKGKGQKSSEESLQRRNTMIIFGLLGLSLWIVILMVILICSKCCCYSNCACGGGSSKDEGGNTNGNKNNKGAQSQQLESYFTMGGKIGSTNGSQNKGILIKAPPDVKQEEEEFDTSNEGSETWEQRQWRLKKEQKEKEEADKLKKMQQEQQNKNGNTLNNSDDNKDPQKLNNGLLTPEQMQKQKQNEKQGSDIKTDPNKIDPNKIDPHNVDDDKPDINNNIDTPEDKDTVTLSVEQKKELNDKGVALLKQQMEELWDKYKTCGNLQLVKDDECNFWYSGLRHLPNIEPNYWLMYENAGIPWLRNWKFGEFSPANFILYLRHYRADSLKGLVPGKPESFAPATVEDCKSTLKKHYSDDDTLGTTNEEKAKQTDFYCQFLFGEDVDKKDNESQGGPDDNHNVNTNNENAKPKETAEQIMAKQEAKWKQQMKDADIIVGTMIKIRQKYFSDDKLYPTAKKEDFVMTFYLTLSKEQVVELLKLDKSCRQPCGDPQQMVYFLQAFPTWKKTLGNFTDQNLGYFNVKEYSIKQKLGRFWGNQKIIDPRALNQALTISNDQIENVQSPGDGSCQYWSVQKQAKEKHPEEEFKNLIDGQPMKFKDLTIKTIRDNVTAFAIKYQSWYFQTQLDLNKADPDYNGKYDNIFTVEEWANWMKQENQWGDKLSLLIMAIIFDMEIIIFTSYQGSYNIYDILRRGQSKTGRVIAMISSMNCHWDGATLKDTFPYNAPWLPMVGRAIKPEELQAFDDWQADAQTGYETALKEVKAGKKESHWIWYILPTPYYDKGSEKNKQYAIPPKTKPVEDPITPEQYFEIEQYKRRQQLSVKDYLEHEELGLNYFNFIKALNDYSFEGDGTPKNDGDGKQKLVDLGGDEVKAEANFELFDGTLVSNPVMSPNCKENEKPFSTECQPDCKNAQGLKSGIDCAVLHDMLVKLRKAYCDQKVFKNVCEEPSP